MTRRRMGRREVTRRALTVLGVAGVNFVIGVPGADDIMLQYQSTSFHDALYLREVLGLRPAPEFEKWLTEIGLMQPGGRIAQPDQLAIEGRRRMIGLIDHG